MEGSYYLVATLCPLIKMENKMHHYFTISKPYVDFLNGWLHSLISTPQLPIKNKQPDVIEIHTPDKPLNALTRLIRNYY